LYVASWHLTDSYEIARSIIAVAVYITVMMSAKLFYRIYVAHQKL